jgi:hypothetical protein
MPSLEPKPAVVLLTMTLVALLPAAAVAQSAQQPPPTKTVDIPPPPPKTEAKNMALVGYHDLQARSAYQPTIHKQGDRWIAYIGHHGGTREIPKPVNPMNGAQEFNGTSLIDVTDPKKPKYLAHIPGDEGLGEQGGAQMVRVCDGKALPKGDASAVYMLRTFGNSAHEVWNTADPASPKLVTRIDGIKGTHKNFWECETGVAFLVSGRSGWRVPRMTEIYDMSNPAAPVKIRDFGLPGQQPGAAGPVPTQLHGAISTGPKGNRVYFGYGTNQGGVMQIVDREKLLNGPKEPTDENLRAPVIGQLDMSPLVGAHTTLPVLEMPIAEFAKDKVGKVRNFVVVTDEQILNECLEPRQFVWFVDVTVENRPASVSTWGVPEASGNFCSRGGRFGTHASNESMAPIYYKRLMFFSHFNAGVRAVDIRDPYHPKEVASYVPPITKSTAKRCIRLDDGSDRCKTAIQTNNVEVDDRGYIYIVDRANTGMHILELTGAARKIANFPK